MIVKQSLNPGAEVYPRAGPQSGLFSNERNNFFQIVVGHLPQFRIRPVLYRMLDKDISRIGAKRL